MRTRNARAVDVIFYRPLLLALVGFAICWLAPASSAAAAELALASDGKASLPIILIDPNGELAQDPLLRPSIDDLRATLRQMTGADFEFRTAQAAPPEGEPGIYIATADHFPAAVSGKALSPQEYHIRSTGNALYLVGGDARGLSHAIYGLLQNLGCRWFYPGQTWAVIPERPALTVDIDERQRPDFPSVRRIWMGSGMHSSQIRADYAAWERRNRIAGPYSSIGHTWFGLDPEKDFAAHPEWFAETKGKRQPTKPCYSHPEVIARGIRYAIEHFKENPQADMVSASPPDGTGFCACELCREQAQVNEVFEAHGTEFGRRADGTLVSLASETVFAFANQMADAVAEQFPGKRVGMMAYSAYAHPPAFDLRPNIYVELTRGYRRTPLSQTEQIAAFAQKAKELGIYEYYDVQQWSWEQPGRARASDLDYVQASLRFYRRLGMQGVNGEMSNNFAPNGIGYYAIARLLWDAQQDVRAIESEFYEAFGPAADQIRQVYRRWESGQGFDDRALAATYRNLEEAVRLTAPDSAERRRVDHLRLYAHFLKIYLQLKEGGNTHEEDVALWKQRFGEDKAKERVEEFGTWVRRLMDTHMIHSWPLNRMLAKRGELLGIDTSEWMQPGPIPTAEEIDDLFREDMDQLAGVPVLDVPTTVFSKRLVPITGTAAGRSLPGVADRPIQCDTFRAGRLQLLVSEVGETCSVDFDQKQVACELTFTPLEEYRAGAGDLFGEPLEQRETDDGRYAFTAKQPGYYTLSWQGAAVTAVSHPHALLGTNQKFKNATLYFYVPHGTRQFIVETAAYGGPTLTIADAQGRPVHQRKGFDATQQIEENWQEGEPLIVDVPAGADGGVWSLTGPGDVNTVASVRLIGVPPSMSFNPAQLLVPEEVVNRIEKK